MTRDVRLDNNNRRGEQAELEEERKGLRLLCSRELSIVHGMNDGQDQDDNDLMGLFCWRAGSLSTSEVKCQ